MYAVIMAGGKGTRLSKVTNGEIPKPMVSLCGKPILEYQIKCLKKNGITEIFIIIGHLGEIIESYFEDGFKWDVHIKYIYEKEPLGTGGALFYLKNRIREDFLLVFGDLIFDIDILRFQAFHEKHHADCTLLVHPNTHPYDSDLLILNNDSKVVGYVSKKINREKDYNNLVNSGLYMISSDFLEKINEIRKIDFEKDLLFPMISDKREIYGYCSSEYIKDVGTPERLRQAEMDLRRGIVSAKNLCKKQKCVFIDRDGTVNKYIGLLHKVQQLDLESHVVEALQILNQSEYLVIIVTNQPVVARGMCSVEDVEQIHRRLETLLGNAGVYLDKIIFCPHHPDAGYEGENPIYKIKCRCRKPEIGMLQKCAEQYNIDLKKSWMIGDSTIDIQCGKNAHMHTALVRTGVAGKDKRFDAKPEIVCDDLLDAVEKIMRR